MKPRTVSSKTSLELNGFRAWICCDGEPLPVYQVTSVDNQTTKCYAPSQAGKEFQVQVQSVEPRLSQHDSFNARLFTDGYERTGQGAPKDDTIKLQNVRTSSDFRQPLIFTPLETTDDTNSASEVEPDKVGLVEIRVWWAEKAPEKRTVVFQKQDGPTRIHERSKKGGFNVATLGEPIYDKERLPERQYTWYTRIGSLDNPVAVLRFYHQPLAMLQAAGIVPIQQSAPSMNPPPADPPSRKRPLSWDKNAESGPSKKTRAQTIPVTSTSPPDASNDDQVGLYDLHEDVKPIPEATEDVKPQVLSARDQTITFDRAAQLEAQIAARKIRVKRLAEEEQLAVEEAELAQLRAQAQTSQRKGKEREQRNGAREVVDLTMD
ncbi:hypothetical protein PENSPDRAFT_653573, partial [Peniophora sp. CONT]